MTKLGLMLIAGGTAGAVVSGGALQAPRLEAYQIRAAEAEQAAALHPADLEEKDRTMLETLHIEGIEIGDLQYIRNAVRVALTTTDARTHLEVLAALRERYSAQFKDMDLDRLAAIGLQEDPKPTLPEQAKERLKAIADSLYVAYSRVLQETER